MGDLPPLQAVKVFDAVARHGNFTKAAGELNMTQSAVSYQIKLLERFVGAPLFVRQARGVTLAERGELLAPMVRRALGDLAQSFRSVAEKSGSVLVISTIQTIAGNWLAPRIGAFQMLHPEFAVRLDISTRLVDFESEDVDVAIRSGKGEWRGLVSHFLFDQSFTAVCSPIYIEREGRPKTPAELLSRILIAPSDDWWPLWFAKAGVASAIKIERPGIDVENQQMAASVAAAGHGVALVTPGFVGEDLKAGRLVQLFDVLATSGSNYFLVYPEPRRGQPKIATFRDWILEQAGVRPRA